MEIGEIIYEEWNGIIKTPFKTESIGVKGVWALYGIKPEDSEYECLNVGKSKDIGKEILYDLSCLHFISFREDGTVGYVNQFNKYCGFFYKPGQPQEYLYPYIALNYKCLKFIYIYKENSLQKEIDFAKSNQALFWRNGRPYKAKCINDLIVTNKEKKSNRDKNQ